MSENKRIYKIEAVPVREETLPPSDTNPEYTDGAYGYEITVTRVLRDDPINDRKKEKR